MVTVGEERAQGGVTERHRENATRELTSGRRGESAKCGEGAAKEKCHETQRVGEEIVAVWSDGVAKEKCHEEIKQLSGEESWS
jgi:hypothetical protein